MLWCLLLSPEVALIGLRHLFNLCPLAAGKKVRIKTGVVGEIVLVINPVIFNRKLQYEELSLTG
jgi:hypothetical protein